MHGGLRASRARTPSATSTGLSAPANAYTAVTSTSSADFSRKRHPRSPTIHRSAVVSKRVREIILEIIGGGQDRRLGRKPRRGDRRHETPPLAGLRCAPKFAIGCDFLVPAAFSTGLPLRQSNVGKESSSLTAAARAASDSRSIRAREARAPRLLGENQCRVPRIRNLARPVPRAAAAKWQPCPARPSHTRRCSSKFERDRPSRACRPVPCERRGTFAHRVRASLRAKPGRYADPNQRTRRQPHGRNTAAWRIDPYSSSARPSTAGRCAQLLIVSEGRGGSGGNAGSRTRTARAVGKFQARARAAKPCSIEHSVFAATSAAVVIHPLQYRAGRGQPNAAPIANRRIRWWLTKERAAIDPARRTWTPAEPAPRW